MIILFLFDAIINGIANRSYLFIDIRIWTQSLYCMFLYFCIFVIGVFLYIHLLAVTNPNAAFDLIDSNSLVILTVLDGIPRVVIKTFVFVVPLFAYLLLFIKNRALRYILVVICFFVVILSQTYGILLGILGVYLIYKYILNQKVQLIVILFLFLMTCMYIIWGTDFLDEEKWGLLI